MRGLCAYACTLLALLSLSPVLEGQTASTAPLNIPTTLPVYTTATCGKPVCTWDPFGPQTFTRQTGQPQAVTASFSILNPNTQYTLAIQNNGVASAVISLNGVEIFGPSDFNSNVAALQKPVALQLSNTLSVELRSKPGSSLAITVIGVDNDPPGIAYTENPPPNQYGWNNANVTLDFTCTDQTSGVAFCSSPVTLTTEGLNQPASGMARDLAGNSATVTVPVSIDKTPPTITAQASPAPNAAGWNNTPVTVSFACSDALSGVAFCPAAETLSAEGANQLVSGTAMDRAGNGATASASVSIDMTPPVVSITSPADGAVVTAASLTVTGNVSDALSGVRCNGAAATVSGGRFSCALQLVGGVNPIAVQATDVAGNTAAASISVTFNPAPIVPPKAIFITPSQSSLVVGDSRTVNLVGDIGQMVPGATWTISDPTIAGISAAPGVPANTPPQITALAPGLATLTANFNGLSATMSIHVYGGASLPIGTPIWSVNPMPGNSAGQIAHGNPVNPGDPDIYVIEGSNTLRALTADGRQLWVTQVAAGPAPAAPLVSGALTAQANTVTPISALATLPPDLQANLEEHGVFDVVQSILDRQQHAVERMQGNTAGQPLQSAPSPGPVNMLAVAATQVFAPGPYVLKTVADNNGGTINFVFYAFGARNAQGSQDSLSRIDNATHQETWRYDAPRLSGLDTNFAIAPDNTLYISETHPGSGIPGFAGIPITDSVILGFDATTGLQKLSAPIPPGHTTIISNGIVAADGDLASTSGPLAVMPDGSVQTVISTVNFTDTTGPFHSGVPCCEIAVSDDKKVRLFQLQADGSSSAQMVHEFDFDRTNCVGSCHDPSSLLIPAAVIPDGAGGALAGWRGTDPTLSPYQGGYARIRRFDAFGGVTDYTLPLSRVPTWGPDPSQALVLGENNVVYASDGVNVASLDLSTGGTGLLWQPGVNGGAALLASTDPAGLAILDLTDRFLSTDAFAQALVTFDASGAQTSFPFSVANDTNVSYFDQNTLLAISSAGQAVLAQGVTVPTAFDLWEFVSGNIGGERAPDLKIKLSPAQKIMDGETGSFSVTTTLDNSAPPRGQSPLLTYQWSFSAPRGAGNNPEVTFSNPTGASTNTDGHWFALPNAACPTPADLPFYYDAEYHIKATVQFDNGKPVTKEAKLTVNALWNPAGYVNPNPDQSDQSQVARIIGIPDMAPDASGVWRVTGMGTLARQVPTKAVINVIPTSQFYDKTVKHEQVHLSQFLAGPGHLFGDLWSPSDFFNQIRNITGTSFGDLFNKLGDANNAYEASQFQILSPRLPQAEVEAHAVSDAIPPLYVYQLCQGGGPTE